MNGSKHQTLVPEDLRCLVVETPRVEASVEDFVTLISEEVSSGIDRKVDIRGTAL